LQHFQEPSFDLLESVMKRIDSIESSSLAHESRPLESKTDAIKKTVSEKLRTAARAVADKATDPRMQDTLTGRYGPQVSSWLNSSADYVSEMNVEQVKSDLQQQVRRNPGRSLLIAGAFGLLLGSLLRRR
jgi:ElaB/YqjD/DUF883 family membrane-anchored ribosome-binding protein